MKDLPETSGFKWVKIILTSIAFVIFISGIYILLNYEGLTILCKSTITGLVIYAFLLILVFINEQKLDRNN